LLDRLRDHIATYLAKHQTCVISTAGPEGVQATLVRYHSRGLEVDCLIPRWADVAYHLERGLHVVLIIQDTTTPGMRWLQYRGTSHPVENPDWTEWLISEPSSTNAAHDTRYAIRTTPELYRIARITPIRIDLLDESRGWGERETLDL